MVLIRSHWFWFFAILTVLSGADYWEHISRPGSAFEQAPGAWFGFTAASHVTLLVVAFLSAKALSRLPVPTVLADALGVAVAIAVHLLLSGSFWDRVFWNGALSFDAVLIPALAAMTIYLIYRSIFWLIARLLGRQSESLP